MIRKNLAKFAPSRSKKRGLIGLFVCADSSKKNVMTEKLMSQKTGARNGRRLNWSDRIRNFVGRSLKAALPGVAIALASQVQTQADITFKAEQVGPDVVLTATGSINTGQLFANGWTQNKSNIYGGSVGLQPPGSSFSFNGFIASGIFQQ